MTAGDKYYRSKLDTEQLRRLHQRSDVAAVLRVLGHLGSLVSTGWLFFLCTLNGWWVATPFVLLLHGTLFSFLGYAGASHEFSHHTVFKKKGPNIFSSGYFPFLYGGITPTFSARTRFIIAARSTLKSTRKCLPQSALLSSTC